MSKPCQLCDLDDGTDLTPSGPGFTLTPDDPLAGELVALWAALRARNFGQCNQLLFELIGTARRLPAEDGDKLAEASACAVEMAAWRLRRRDALLAAAERENAVIETRPYGNPLLSEIRRDMRRAALDRILLAGNCEPGDLIEHYGFSHLAVITFAAGVIAEARRLAAGGELPVEGAAA